MFSLSTQDLQRELRSFQTQGHCTQNVLLQVSGQGFLLEKTLPAALVQAPRREPELSRKDLGHHDTPGLTLNPLAGQNHNLFFWKLNSVPRVPTLRTIRKVIQDKASMGSVLDRNCRPLLKVGHSLQTTVRFKFIFKIWRELGFVHFGFCLAVTKSCSSIFLDGKTLSHTSRAQLL